MAEEDEGQYRQGDFLYIVYKDGTTRDRKAKGKFLREDDTSITIDIGGVLFKDF